MHGAWHTPDHFSAFTFALERAGFLIVAPRLPSVNGDKPPTKTFTDDVDTIRREAKNIIDQGHQFVFLGHSHGVMVITNALTPEYSIPARQENRHPGGVIHLVYTCAWLLRMGESIMDYHIPGSGTILDVARDE